MHPNRKRCPKSGEELRKETINHTEFKIIESEDKRSVWLIFLVFYFFDSLRLVCASLLLFFPVSEKAKDKQAKNKKKNNKQRKEEKEWPATLKIDDHGKQKAITPCAGKEKIAKERRGNERKGKERKEMERKEAEIKLRENKKRRRKRVSSERKIGTLEET